MTDAKVVVCPYCGAAQTAGRHCGLCKADFGPLARRATQNQMGPWSLRDEENPFRPGYSYESMVKLIDAGQVTRYSIVRGPTTNQLWTVARKTPGIAHLLGDCHHCNGKVEKGVTRCPGCRTVFGAWLDRNHLGLPDVRPMPGDPDEILDSGESTDQYMHGFRPLASEGVSAFLHVDEATAATTTHESNSESAEDIRNSEVNSHVEESASTAAIFDQALRTELAVARQHSNRMTILAVVAIVAAVGTLLIAVFKRPASSEVPTTGIESRESSEMTKAPLPNTPEVLESATEQESASPASPADSITESPQ